MPHIALESLDLAALLCSRVCHDVISPVGAIVNGLEVLEDEKDADMRAFALELIKKSATTASARLQFCRLAFGAAGSAGASIDTGDAESVTRGLIGNDIERNGGGRGYSDSNYRDSNYRRAAYDVERVPVTREVQRCNVVNDFREEVRGYDVRYRYGNREYSTRLAYDPGPTMPVNVEVRPSYRAPAASYNRY